MFNYRTPNWKLNRKADQINRAVSEIFNEPKLWHEMSSIGIFQWRNPMSQELKRNISNRLKMQVKKVSM